MTRAEPNRLLSRDVFGPVRQNHQHHTDEFFLTIFRPEGPRNRVATYTLLIISESRLELPYLHKDNCWLDMQGWSLVTFVS